MVIVGSCKGTLTALDAESGEVLWQYDITADGEQSNFHGDALVTEGMFLIGTDGIGVGHLYAFDVYSGEVMWKYPDTRGVSTDIQRHGDTIVAVTLGEEILCLDLFTGTPMWTAPGDGGSDDRDFNLSPAVTETRVFYGSLEGRVDAYDIESGEPAWSQPLGSRVTTSVVAHDGHVFAGTDNNMIWRIDPESGAADTLVALTRFPSQEMVYAEGHLFVLLDWTLDGSELAAIDMRTGSVTWRAAPSEGHKWTCARPYLVGESVVVGCGEGHVRAYRATDGTPSWSMTVDGTVRGMGFSDAAAFIGTLGGTLYRVDLEAAQ